MMFLFKLTFWLGLVLILLPTGSKQHANETPPIKIAEAASAATAAVSDLSNFCTRQPNSCAVGSQVASVLAQRAQDGAIMVYEFITERRESEGDETRVVPVRHMVVAGDGRPDHATTGSIGGTPPAIMLPRPRPMRSQDTLTVSDRAPAWRPELRQEARLQH